jgi:hypothetical protein
MLMRAGPPAELGSAECDIGLQANEKLKDPDLQAIQS